MEINSSKCIQFFLGDEPRELCGISPTVTVLEYLRGVEKLTGTKEGCAEGDCGACTVVLGSNVDGKIEYEAVNSCILFLPALNGYQLITVEHLKDDNNELHPVQRVLVDEHGSQCGFCTPGFVMSMFAMYHNHCDSSRGAIDDALAGNLCRCTGYAPIVRASKKMLSNIATDKFDRAEDITVQKLARLNDSHSVYLQSDCQTYYAPCTIEELATFLQKYPNSTIVSGATDVGLWVTKQRRNLQSVIFIGNIDSLQRVEITDQEIRIGACATVSTAMDVLSSYYPSLDELFRRYGSVQIRNRATVGGNVANGSPIGDSLPTLVVLNATLILRSVNGCRELPAEEFFIDYGVQNLQPGEFLERIDIPLPVTRQEFRTYKLSKRFHQDISAVCGAFSVTFNSDMVESVRICYGGMAATPKRARHCEDVLRGARITESVVSAAVTALNLDYSPITDFRGNLNYRSMAAANILRRFLNEVTSKEERNVWKVNCA